MKHLLKTAFLLLIVSLLGCSKDDSDRSINTVKMNGEPFKILSASIMGVSIDNDGHTGITFANGNEANIRTLTIDIESFTKETIEGTYSYPTLIGDKILDDWLTNYSFFEESSNNSSNLETGTVTVVHNSDTNYTIEMDLLMVDGTTFKGTYTGEFTVMFLNN